MIVTLTNFGPIREFSIDLDKDFHLLVGANNIGKSYAITAIYLVLKTLLETYSRNTYIHMHDYMFIDQRMLFDDSVFYEFSRPTNIKKEIFESIEAADEREEINISQFVESDVKTIFEQKFIFELNKSFLNTFSSLESLRNCFSDESLKIVLENENLSTTIGIKEKKLAVTTFNLKRSFFVKKIKQKRDPYEKGQKTVIYYCNSEDAEKYFSIRYFRYCVYKSASLMFQDVMKSISGVHYLPASRSGLYQALSAFGQIIAELSKNRSFLTKKIELPGISEPVSDYFLKLSDIRVKKRSFEDKEINQIAKKIEDKILKGRVEFDTQTKQLMFYPDKTQLKLELSSTSSMVSELAPIVSYLRYVLTQRKESSSPSASKAKALIMIEEPEAHLHPSVQILLTEIFSDLANIGVKVILTSHSNYIFNKVNNLIMSGRINKDIVSSTVFKMTAKGSVSPDLEVNEFGIEDDNFSEPTEELYSEKMNIIHKMNNEENENQ